MPQPIRQVAVLGAGTMGAGIAQTIALSGVPVRLQDVSAEALDQGVERSFSRLDRGVERGKVSPEQRDRARKLMTPETDRVAAVKDADLVIEAIPEILNLKRETFAEIAALCPTTAILASNTSSLSIAAIAEATPDPARVLGLHFFNPPHIMKLVEIVKSDRTSKETLETAQRFVESLEKVAIVVKDSPGFATSRLGLAIALEAMRMLEQGVASAEDIDKAMKLGYGHPMGPLELSDLVGLDVRLKIAEILHTELKADHFAPPRILKRLVREGKLGKKTGQGFHIWEPGK
jgi:3-hydroxybutyryl-CoA dehydrogenase